MDWNLLEKTTFTVDGIELETANLGQVAETAADVLRMNPKDVMVVDVRSRTVTFDIMRRQVKAEDIIGKAQDLLHRLGEIPGVQVDANATVHSEGVLGLIALDEDEAAQVVSNSQSIATEVSSAVQKRAIVFSSGSEVIAGEIEDTNSPYIVKCLQEAGYSAKFGGILPDNVGLSVEAIENALSKGYGLVITTGGVGAEDKDFSVEATCYLDSDACTPWILKFEKDGHRHHKEGVRIAVGQIGITRVINLPGPHEEAVLGCNRAIEGLGRRLAKADLAQYIAAGLRERWQNQMRGDN